MILAFDVETARPGFALVLCGSLPRDSCCGRSGIRSTHATLIVTDDEFGTLVAGTLAIVANA
jgi:hypothetical protein